MPSPAPLGRPFPERVQAWVVTGPLGHLWSVVADIVLLWLRWGFATARARLRGP